MRMETEVTALTLNCWGIKGISRDRVERMNAIADELATDKYDFVFLQEVWTTEDYERIRNRTRLVLPYSHYFYSGVIGSGLCIFSRSPITSAFFHQWAVNGYIHKIQHGDWFGGKGIGMVQVLHRGLRINLYTAHLHAEYDRVNDEYLAHRVIQSFDTAQFITVTSQRADAVVIGGDLNTEPGDLAYRVIVHTAQLKDSFFETPKPPGSGDAQCYTCDTPGNSYASRRALRSNPFGKRIDYIIYKAGDNVSISTLSCATPLPKLVPGKPYSYSDHEAVVSKFRITKSSSALEPSPTSECARKEALEECIEICNQALRHLSRSKAFYLTIWIACIITVSITGAFEIFKSAGIILPIVNIFILLVLVYCTFMGLIWNRIEVHGILAGKLAMELEVDKHASVDGGGGRRLSLSGAGDHWSNNGSK